MRTLVELVNVFDCYAGPFFSVHVLNFFNQHLLFPNCRAKTALGLRAKSKETKPFFTFHVLCLQRFRSSNCTNE